MKRQPKTGRRITGLETEYGCLVAEGFSAHATIARVRDWVFDNRRYGLLDVHDRDWDEPAGNGGFLFNGGRVYLDMGHLEYCTPECASARDIVRYDRAGDALLNRAVRELGMTGQVNFIRNNVDHRTGATFGCHENYSMDREAPLDEPNVFSLLAFLTLRVLLSGSGRVGGARTPQFPGERPRTEKRGPFQISQRADYIQNDFYEWVQHNRAIVNTRDEPLADARRYRRLHLLHGDANVLPSALYLKVGTTRLVLDLLEANALPRIALQDAVGTLHALSRRPQGPWRVALAGGTEADAIELLELYRERAEKLFGGRDEDTEGVLAAWESADARLAGGDLGSLVGTLDWVTKQFLLQEFVRAEGLDWNDPWLESQDIEYHHIDPERSLGLPLADLAGPWGDAFDLARDLQTPPADTRAGLRSRVMRELSKTDAGYVVDWDLVGRLDGPPRHLSDPFATQ